MQSQDVYVANLACRAFRPLEQNPVNVGFAGRSASLSVHFIFPFLAADKEVINGRKPTKVTTTTTASTSRIRRLPLPQSTQYPPLVAP